MACFAAIVCRQLYYFLLVQKVTKNDTTPKDTSILLSHNLTALIAMQNFVSAPGVDCPRTEVFDSKCGRFEIQAGRFCAGRGLPTHKKLG